MAERRRPETERDYVLGTDDEEIARLGIQHDAWRPIVRECWRHAGIAPGWDVLDVGAGPGYAAADLAEIVGPTGSVTAVERSHRFTVAGAELAERLGLANLHYRESDLMHDPLPTAAFDAAWCRWVCSFVGSPHRLVEQMARALRPGGVAVFHEYVDYASWRFSPPRPLLDEYVRQVMQNWRAAGGEPDIAMCLMHALDESGFTVRYAMPQMFCVTPASPLWQWISTFVASSLKRMPVPDGRDASWSTAVEREFRDAEGDPRSLMLTPAVLEIVADLQVR